jgi:lipoprotein
MTHKIKNTLIITTRIATVLFLTLTLFISCQKNNDKEPEDEPSIINKQDLIGTWAFNANNYVYKDCVEKRRLVFSEKEVTNYFYNFDKKKNECFNMVWTMSYRLSGDKIILKYSNGATLTNKIELSGNELRLTFFDDTLSKQMITQIYTRQSNEKKNIH